MSNNCLVAQSGGPTAAINASLAGVVSGVIKSNRYDKIYGSIHGIQGVFNQKYLDLSDSTPEFIEKLAHTPAMYLGSCRFKLPSMDKDPDVYKRIFSEFNRMNISAFFYIGGNDSMDTVDKLSAYAAAIGSDIKIAGVPKTIDNDLVKTDHTPGFGSAAKYVASSIREIAYDTYIYDVESVTIIEVMGRDAGWLTASSVLARTDFSRAPHLIYLPETAFDTEAFLSDIKLLLPKYRNVIVAVSEGIRDKDGNYISAGNAVADNFGHAQLSGAGKCLENLVKTRLGVKVRSVEINVLQRCAGHMISENDISESMASGENAVKLTEEGHSGFMTTIKRLSNKPYAYSLDMIPVNMVANKAKAVPSEWINNEGNDVTDEMITYLKPLVQGERPVSYQNGIVSYLDISHLNRQ